MEHNISVSPSVLTFNSTGTEKQTFQVTTDGEFLGFGFRYDISGDGWFDIIPEGQGKFSVSVKDNFNISERIGYVTFHHNSIQGEDGERVLTVKQNGVDCSISVSPSTINFTSTNNNKDEKEITVTVNGGNKKFFIQSFKEFNSEDKLIKNDNGIKVIKVSNEKLKITSYGQVFMNDGNYYKVVLAHDNDRSKTVEIKVNYDGYTPKDTVPSTSISQLSTLRTISVSNAEVSTMTFQETLDNYHNEAVQESYLTLTSINPTTKKLLRSKSANSDEIIFENNGGSKTYQINKYPEKAPISVKISSNFITYKINDGILTLTAVPNPYIIERKCTIRIRNVYDPFGSITKTIIQKGNE